MHMKNIITQAQLEYNKLKILAEKLDFERDANKKRLLEITDHQFKVNTILIHIHVLFFINSRQIFHYLKKKT